MAYPSWKTLEEEARAAVVEVEDDPEGRYQMRERFYESYGFAHPLGLEKHGLGNSELDFMRWEIERGVLNRISEGGSAWWREVNASFLVSGDLAARGHKAGLPEKGAPVGARAWMRYFRNPGAETWYRAHNTNIAEGYLACRRLAFKENCHEQSFMNIVLYRVLFAQAMVEDADYALAPLGDFLANPRFLAVQVAVELPDFYPQHYPLNAEDIRCVHHAERSLGGIAVDILDEIFILPHLSKLYHQAARWNEVPDIARLLRKGEPIYPQLTVAPCQDFDDSLCQKMRELAQWCLLHARRRVSERAR